ncbi:hypothetical protein DBADOPDK_04665 [Pseudomonas sp. MM223]|nr:hypothetical protein DBADOPDK_04665 [Pseudomonas sp. MM223]
MAVETDFSQDGKKLTIKIKGRFDFGKHQEFRDAYERQPDRPDSVVVDLKDTTYLDSSALGMLLLLRDHAGGDESDVRVVHASPTCARSSPFPISKNCSTSVERRHVGRTGVDRAGRRRRGR